MYPHQAERLGAELERGGLAALVAASAANVAYVTGFWSLARTVDPALEIYAVVAPGGTALALTWAEAIGTNDTERNQKRFGSVALERVVPASLNGTATLEIEPGRLEYRLVVPHGNFETE